MINWLKKQLNYFKSNQGTIHLQLRLFGRNIHIAISSGPPSGALEEVEE